jgi:hypothetical protein
MLLISLILVLKITPFHTLGVSVAESSEIGCPLHTLGLGNLFSSEVGAMSIISQTSPYRLNQSLIIEISSNSQSYHRYRG